MVRSVENWESDENGLYHEKKRTVPLATSPRKMHRHQVHTTDTKSGKTSNGCHAKENMQALSSAGKRLPLAQNQLYNRPQSGLHLNVVKPKPKQLF